MAEIDPGEHWTADRDNLFRDTLDNNNAYRRVRDPKVIEILEQIADSLEITTGESHFVSVTTATTPGVLQNLITENVPVDTIRQISQVIIICRQEGSGFIYADGNLIGSVRTSASNPNASFTFNPRYPVATGLEIKIDFRSRAGSPMVDVDCHLQAVDKPT
jgi:hypothetical protein